MFNPEKTQLSPRENNETINLENLTENDDIQNLSSLNMESPQEKIAKLNLVYEKLEKAFGLKDVTKEYINAKIKKIFEPVKKQIKQYVLASSATLGLLSPAFSQDTVSTDQGLDKENKEIIDIFEPEVSKDVYFEIKNLDPSSNNCFWISKDLKLTASSGEDIFVNQGDEFIFLKTNISGQSEGLVWKNGEYINVAIENNVLTQNFENIEFETEVFKNNTTHILQRSKSRLYQETRGSYEEMLEEYGTQEGSGIDREFIDKEIENQIAKHQDFISFLDHTNDVFLNTIQNMNSADFESIKTQHEKRQSIYSNKNLSKGEILSYTIQNIFKTYDPVMDKNTGEKVSELVIPIILSRSFFDNNPSIDISEYQDLKSYFNGGSGEIVMQQDPRFVEILESIKNLKQQVGSLSDSFEKQWLQNLDIDILEKKKAFVFISDNVYEMSDRERFAEGVTVNNSFSSLKTHPIQTVLIHEINMASNMLPTDTHISKENSLDTFYKTKKQIEDGESVKISPTEIDDLYKSDSYIELVNLAIILNNIN